MNKLYIISGTPASGKSTWVRQQIANGGGVHISRDSIRFSMIDSVEEYFSKETEVFEEFIRQVREAMTNGVERIFVDATHINKFSRRKTLDLLDFSNPYEVIYIKFETPLNTCLERNAKREGLEHVPSSVIRRMFYQKDDFFEYYGENTTLIRIDENGEIIE